MVPDIVKYHVVGPPTRSEILARVVNHMRGTERTDEVHIVCTAKLPAPPAAPLISTFWPGWTPAASRIAFNAVMPATGTADACSKLRFAGLRASSASRAAAYSANER